METPQPDSRILFEKQSEDLFEHRGFSLKRLTLKLSELFGFSIIYFLAAGLFVGLLCSSFYVFATTASLILYFAIVLWLALQKSHVKLSYQPEAKQPYTLFDKYRGLFKRRRNATALQIMLFNTVDKPIYASVINGNKTYVSLWVDMTIEEIKEWAEKLDITVVVRD